MNVELPDGRILEDIPDGTTKAQILSKLKSNGIDTSGLEESKTKPPSLLNKLSIVAPVVSPDLTNTLKTVSNIPSSAMNFAGGLVNTISHPIDSATGIWKAFKGGVQLIPGATIDPNSDYRQIARNVGDFYKQRYGSMDSIKNTIINDPVGASADASVISGLAGTGLRVAGMGNAADVASTISQYTNPVYLASKGIGAVAKPIYKSLVSTVTGSGTEPVESALQNIPGFKEGLRNPSIGENLVSDAKDALSNIKNQRGDAYRSQLENLQSISKEIPIDDIKNLADSWLKRYNVRIDANGKLDFSRSTVSGTAANEVNDVYQMVKDWGSKTGDTTPAMLDVLKRRLDDFYSTSRNSRAMVTGMRNAVKDKIISEVPQYGEMTKDYAKASELVNETEKALSLGTKSSADTALRKIMMSMREDANFRRDLIATLDKSGTGTIAGQAAGATMNPLWSRRLGPTAVAFGSLEAAFFEHNPKILALTAIASPRISGELSLLLGRIGRGITSPTGQAVSNATYMTGAISNTNSKRQDSREVDIPVSGIPIIGKPDDNQNGFNRNNNSMRIGNY